MATYRGLWWTWNSRPRCSAPTWIGRAYPALDEPPQKIRRLLAVRDAGERTVLAFDEHAAVDKHLDQKARLALGEAEGAEGVGPFLRQLVDVPLVGWKRQVHRKSSAARGSNGTPRLLLLPLP